MNHSRHCLMSATKKDKEGDDMTGEQFTAFYVLLAAVSVPSVSLLFAGAWELWRYAKRVQP
jgi:hypothetical protein